LCRERGGERETPQGTTADGARRRTLLTSAAGLEQAKQLVTAYKMGKVRDMTPELWHAKKTIDSTIHPDTGEPVMLPFRMSSFVLSNLIVTGGMLTPGLGVRSCLNRPLRERE
jgi:hypothetical protein